MLVEDAGAIRVSASMAAMAAAPPAEWPAIAIRDGSISPAPGQAKGLDTIEQTLNTPARKHPRPKATPTPTYTYEPATPAATPTTGNGNGGPNPWPT